VSCCSQVVFSAGELIAASIAWTVVQLEWLPGWQESLKVPVPEVREAFLS
jgi:hypothetical protein